MIKVFFGLDIIGTHYSYWLFYCIQRHKCMKNNKDIAISYLKFMVEIVFFYFFFVIPKIIISIVWFDSFQTTKFITTDKTHWTILHSFCFNNKNAQCSLSLFEVAFELWEFNDFTRHFHKFRVFNRMKNLEIFEYSNPIV